MHTLLEGILHYELLLVLNKYIENKSFTLETLNGSIESHQYGHTEISNKPIPLRNSLFNGTERYKLKFEANQARVFLKLFPFIVGPLIDVKDSYYLFVIKLMEITSLIFAPVITETGINILHFKIAKHLSEFKELFPTSNLLPKHHYLVHISYHDHTAWTNGKICMFCF